MAKQETPCAIRMLLNKSCSGHVKFTVFLSGHREFDRVEILFTFGHALHNQMEPI